MYHLQVTAGGKLYNVVVDTESTGKQLLQNGDLRRRVTIIPLNKIQAHAVPPRVQQAAARLVCHFFDLITISSIFLTLFVKELEITSAGWQGERTTGSFSGWLQ